ncbi:hypothetical protein HDE69_003027 [Pedobacter cryoconitis]|uniref:Uncharacterized protein n=1 Tax=Pedobacter cryoconitis TaxID=188932 RepID=A0A7W8YUC5_9SPHI|nr:hypothetical protein [Pedobacter cryoconitis]
MKKLFVIPAFLIFMSAIPEHTVQPPVMTKPQDSLKIDLLNHKLQKLDSLIQAT